MSETTEEVLETKNEVVEQPTEDNKPMSYDEGVIKINLDELNKPQEDAIPEQSTDDSNDVVEEPKDSPSSEEVVQEVREPSEEDVQSVLEEITDEEVQEQVEDLQEDIQEAITEQQNSGIELPENIQKVVEFINETGGSLEDYVKLNTDYSALNETQLLREYYENTRPHLDKEEIDFLMEDNLFFIEVRSSVFVILS